MFGFLKKKKQPATPVQYLREDGTKKASQKAGAVREWDKLNGPAKRNKPQGQPAVSLKGICKRFGKVHANKDINLDIHKGCILALLGENGAGKSTLMSILAGRYQPDDGQIIVNGTPTGFPTSKDAIAAGIGMVYQHFMLVDTMTVAQNVLLGQEEAFFVKPKEMERVVGELAASYDMEIDPSARISDLSMGERQRVEILKLLYRDSSILIFDEPTAVLTPPEIDALFETMSNLAAKGKAIVFISHKLEEVLSLADDIAVLRKGQITDRVDPDEIVSKADLANRMVGRDVLLKADRTEMPVGDLVFEVKGLYGNGLLGIDLKLYKGEVVAIVGVAGNGQKELVETLAGMRPPEKGKVTILGKSWKQFFQTSAWKKTLSYIPEDRLGLGSCPDLDMVDNVLLTTRKGFTRGPFMKHRNATTTTDDLVKDFNVCPQTIKTPAGKLSGGNLQKLVLAREFYRTPQIIIAEQPTQGLDISATEEVWKQLLAARKGAGVLLVTGDLSEALELADHIAVMYRGRFMDVVPTTDTERIKTIGLLMAGVVEN